MPDTLTKLAYQTFQQSKSYLSLAHKTLGSRIREWVAPPPGSTQPLPPALLLDLRQRLDALFEADWQDAERGLYPTSLLFDTPWDDIVRYYPIVWLDMPSAWERMNQKRHQDFDPDIATEDYPSYYVQNFHNQTNGYLSDLSANLYDLQVELLFSGAADPMRRRILAPLQQGLQAFATVPARQMRVLDVACGTGRTLRHLRGLLPQASLYGVDLSAAYLRKANQLLSQNPGELPQLLQANGEALPFQDNYFHATTSVFLFHELPPQARQAVMNECFRVTQPGGTVVLCDSIQPSDSPQFTPMMENFPIVFHEPYYRSYMAEDLAARLTAAGFVDLRTEVHFMSKYWIAQKPSTL
jgi:ubiquinone/menaquinone biosynthesis C-methylase UbiE